jgi:DNA-3-methyladenine glycosylase
MEASDIPFINLPQHSCQHLSALPHQATPIATTPSQHLPALPQCFFARPAEVVAPELIGCLLVRQQPDGGLLWGVIVETEAYCQSDPACHGHRRRSPSNETLFGEPGRFYVYVSYGIHHCVKRAVTQKTPIWA